MERKDMISAIVDAERKAKQITNEAIAKRQGLDEELKQTTLQMKEDFMQRANGRIENVRQTEKRAAEEEIAHLDKKRDAQLLKIDRGYEKYGDNWVDTIFSLVIGRIEL